VPGHRSNGKYAGKIRLSQGTVKKYVNVAFSVEDVILYPPTMYSKFIDADLSDLLNVDQHQISLSLKSLQRNPKSVNWEEVAIENAGILTGLISIQSDQNDGEKYIIRISNNGEVPFGQIISDLRLTFLVNGSTIKTRTFPIRITNYPVGVSCNRRQLLLSSDADPKIVRMRNRDGGTIDINDYSLFDARGTKIVDLVGIGLSIKLENGSIAVHGNYSGKAEYPLCLQLHYSDDIGSRTYALPVMMVPK